MAETTTPSFTSVLDYLHLTLRYIASGFVAVGIFIFLYGSSALDFKDESWFMIFLAATIGIITYAMHFATLDKIFYGWSIMHYLRKNSNHIPPILKEQITSWQKLKGKKDFKEADIFKMEKNRLGVKTPTRIKRYILFGMANQTYLRIISCDETLKSLQEQIEKRLALLNFLYCSSYQILTLTFYFCISKLLLEGCIPKDDFIKVILLVIFAGLVIYSAMRFNNRICSREMWLIQNFSQEIPMLQPKTIVT